MTDPDTPPPAPDDRPPRRAWAEIVDGYRKVEQRQKQRWRRWPVVVTHRLSNPLPPPSPRRPATTDAPSSPGEPVAVKPQPPRVTPTARLPERATTHQQPRSTPPVVTGRSAFTSMAEAVRRIGSQTRSWPKPPAVVARLRSHVPPMAAVRARLAAPVATPDGVRPPALRLPGPSRGVWSGLARAAARAAAVPRVTVAGRLGAAVGGLTPPAALTPFGFSGVMPVPPATRSGLMPQQSAGVAPPTPKTPAPVGTPRGHRGADRATVELFVHQSGTGR